MASPDDLRRAVHQLARDMGGVVHEQALDSACAREELTARAREVLADCKATGLAERDGKCLCDLVAYQRGEAMSWRSDRGVAMRRLRSNGLIDENGWPTDLGREVARLLAEQGGGK